MDTGGGASMQWCGKTAEVCDLAEREREGRKEGNCGRRRRRRKRKKRRRKGGGEEAGRE